MGEKEFFDVVIVGLGPAGSTVGYLLAKQGFSVLGIDYKRFPRFKLCGGLLTWKTQKIIEDIFPGILVKLKDEKNVYFNKLYGISFGNFLYRGELDFPFAIVDRYLYDFFWVQQFKNVGGKVIFDKVVSIDFFSSSVCLASGNKVFASYIIGADGVFSVIRKAIAARGKVRSPRNLSQVLALETFVPFESIRLDYCPYIFLGDISWGYTWIFPAKHGWALGILSKIRDIKKLKKIFLEFCQKWTKTSYQKIYGHFLPYGDFETKPVYKNCFLIGDAAGLVEPILGEGIYYAHKSALALASAFRHSSNLDILKQSFIQNLELDLRELRYAKWWRWFLFTFGKINEFGLFRCVFKAKAKMFEEIIQGKRSFCFGKPLKEK